MVFSSTTFLFYFLPIFFAVYYLAAARNAVLLVGSLIFYAWGEAKYIPLLFAYILINYTFGLLISGSERHSRLLLALGVSANLSMLLYYKYFNFLIGQANEILTAVHVKPLPHTSDTLPLGISFFTFQGISYLIDIKRREISAQKSLLNFAMYKSMFPQLVAGPIVRYRQIAGKVDHRPISLYRIRYGLLQFLIGLSYKVLIANTVAQAADDIFGLPARDLTFDTAWLGAVCYTVQIYFDFAGYSLMAIGLGHMMGFALPPNFNRPYISQSVTEFWRRWHISLSTWFRDYLYIPLGGNRRGQLRTYGNLLAVFFLCGMWHGASWSFAAWGLYHGCFLVFERLGLGRALSAAWRPLRHAYLLIVVAFGWVLFRADSLPHAGQFMAAMLGFAHGNPIETPLAQYLIRSVQWALVGGVVVCLLPRFRERRLHQFVQRSLEMPALALISNGAISLVVSLLPLLLGILCAMSLADGTYNPFIYFRF